MLAQLYRRTAGVTDAGTLSFRIVQGNNCHDIMISPSEFKADSRTCWLAHGKVTDMVFWCQAIQQEMRSICTKVQCNPFHQPSKS